MLLHELTDALSIFKKYNHSADVIGEHDVICVMIDSEISSRDKADLENLDWFWEEDWNCWQHYT